MRALVTGAGGFVGGHLVPHLLECGDEVLAADLRRASIVAPDQERSFQIVPLNITDLDRCSRLISEFNPDVIYHLAGIAFVPEAESDFSQALLVNVGGTHNLVRTCHLLQLGTTVVYVSSAEVYGCITPDELPLREETAIKPANNYSLSKAMGEMVTRRYDQFGYVRSVVLRPFNHIGPGQNNRFVVSNFAHQLAQIAKGKAPPVIRVGNLEAQRDFSDVRDIVRAYRLAALKGSGVYNLCSGKVQSIQWILDTLLEISGLDVRVEHDPERMRPSEVPTLFGSYDKARQELEWEPQYELRDTLETVYRGWLEGGS